MATYILTWNPDKTHLDEDDYNDIVERTREGEPIPSRWSCGHTKRILIGDTLFLLRQGKDRGIVGAGYATTTPYYAEHWNPTQQNKQALYIDFEYETLLPVESRLPIKRLFAANLGVHWERVVASGPQVPDESEEILQRMWSDHLDRIGWQGRTQYVLQPDEVIDATKYVEGATRRVTVNAYERNRDARNLCLAAHGSKCVVCEFDFGKVYGEIGKGFIHVHHLRELASIKARYRVDPIIDMRPVCPNCHTILHTCTPAMSIETLRVILDRNRGK